MVGYNNYRRHPKDGEVMLLQVFVCYKGVGGTPVFDPRSFLGVPWSLVQVLSRGRGTSGQHPGGTQGRGTPPQTGVSRTGVPPPKPGQG